MKQDNYVLVADSNTAIFFTSDKELSGLAEVQTLHNPDAHKTGVDLDSDRPGRQQSSQGGTHGMGGEDNTSKHLQDTFAASVSAALNKHWQAGDFTALHVAAPPHFLGLLRQHLPPNCQKALVNSVNKNLTHNSTAEIIAHFKEA